MRVLLVDDHLLLLQSITAYLSAHIPDVDFQTCSNLAAARTALSLNNAPELAIVDYYMPTSTGVETVRDLICDFPNTRIAIISGKVTKNEISRCLELGIAGFLLKNISVDDMVSAVNSMIHGGVYLPANLIVQKGSGTVTLNSGARLTNRERDVLALIHEGCSNKLIARHLDVTEVTVKMHVSRLLRKYQVKSRIELALKSREDMLFSGDASTV